MNDNSEAPIVGKDRRYSRLVVIILLALVSLSGAVIIFCNDKPTAYSASIVKKQTVEVSPDTLIPDTVIVPESTSMAQVAQVAQVAQAAQSAPAIKPQIKVKDTLPMNGILSLQDEIALLNDDYTVPFTNSFMPGKTDKILLTDYLAKTANGYQLNMHSSSFLTTPTYYDSSLYTSAGFNSRAFYAFNASDGKLKWGSSLSDDGPSSAVIVDSLVVFNTESCTVFALNRFSGKQVWSKWIGDPLLTHLATDGDCIYTAYPSMGFAFDPVAIRRFTHIRPSHAIAAMQAKTGDVKWQRWLDGDIMTSPIICGDEIYLTTFSGTLYKIRKSDGKILNAATLHASSLPTIYKRKIYLAQRINDTTGKAREAIIEVDQKDFKVLRTLLIQDAPYLDYNIVSKASYKQHANTLDMGNGFGQTPDNSGWRKASKLIGQSNVSSLQNFMGSTVIADKGKLYSSFGDSLVCIDIDKGLQMWSRKLPGDINTAGGSLATSPLISGEYLVTVTLRGNVLILDKSNGKLEQSFAIGASVRNQPIIVNNRMFVPTENGKLVKVDAGKLALSDWPMFMKNNAHYMNAD